MPVISPPSAASGSADRLLLLFAVFFTNLLSLACQVIWVRKLSLLFGSTAAVFAIVLSIFLLGLALGALVAGLIVDRSARPWRALALLELLLGAYCLASLRLFDLGRRFFVLTFPNDLDPLAAALAKSLVVLVTVLPPTLAIGAVFPIAVRLYTHGAGRLGGDVSVVYGLDTLGAATGALLAAFVLVPILGLSASVTALGAGALALGAVIVLRSGRTLTATAAGAPSVAADSGPRPWGLLAALFLSGAAALLLETGWNRFFHLLIGTHVYALGVVLAGFLTGIGIGSLVMRPWVDRLRNPDAAVAYLYATIALGGLLVFRSGDTFLRVYFAILEWSQHYHGFQLALSFVVFVVVSLATLPMGATFPLFVRVASGGSARAGASAGLVFFANTLGAMVGALLGELVLLPSGGFAALLLVTLAAYALAAGVFVGRSAGGPARVRLAAACGVLFAAAFLLSPLVRPFELPHHAPYYHGIMNGTWEMYRQVSDQIAVIARQDGFYGQVVVGEIEGHRLLRINGKTDASTRPEDGATQLMVGHVPLLMQARPRDVLVIGLGAGGTLRAAVHHHEVERITLVELDPLVVRTARRYFADYNDHALDDPRVRVVTNDGRNFVESASERWDVITSEPSNIWVAGVSGLFTEEFYRAARARLTPDGLLGQWLPAYEMDPSDVELMLKTMGSVFRHVAYWDVSLDLIVLGSDRPIVADEAEIRRRLAFPGVAADMQSMGMPAGRVPGILAKPHRPPAELPDAVNVDDRPVLEFRTASYLFKALKRVGASASAPAP